MMLQLAFREREADVLEGPHPASEIHRNVDDAHCGLLSARDQLTLLRLVSWGVGHADLISGRKMRCSRRWSRVTLMLANRMIERIAANM